MPRPTWKGHISFGLVIIPVAVYPAEERAELQFHLIDRKTKARVRYERIDEKTGKPVAWSDIARAYEYEKDQYVIMDDEDFKRAAVEATQTIDIEGFTDRDAIDPRYFDRPYYVVPDKKGQKAYKLLLDTLRQTRKVGIAKVVLRTRQYVCALLPSEEDVLVMELLRFKHELRTPAQLDLPTAEAKAQKVSPAETDMAKKLVAAMTTKWDPEQYKDEYRDALLRFIEEKAKSGGRVPVTGGAKQAGEERAGKVVDIMDLLKKSMEQQGGTSRRPARKAESAGSRSAESRTGSTRKASRTSARSSGRKRKAAAPGR